MKYRLIVISVLSFLMIQLASAAPQGVDSALLPPNAKPGECYARVFVSPTYTTITETKLKKAASERVEIIPAVYETVTEELLVKEASTKLVNVPAKYGTESEQVLVSDEMRYWVTNLTSTSKEASDALLDAAKTGGINLDGAQPGDCFHEHYVAPTYEVVTEEVLLNEASERIEIVSAVYETVTEEVLVKEASTKLVNVPAKYGTESEQVLVSDAERFWVTDLSGRTANASDALLAAAKAGGIDLDGAQPGDCYHEHYIAPTYEVVTEEVLLNEASERIETVSAVYETVTEDVLVKEASTKLVNVPATYKYEEEQVLVSPARTEWKEGRGLVEKVSNTTGEIMCLIEVPAVYKTVRKQVVAVAAHVNTIEVPAVYKTVEVRKLVTPAGENRIAIPAKYGTKSKRQLVEAGKYIWHEIHNMELAKETRTGKQICLKEIPAKYRTDTRTVVAEAAKTETVEIPAVYKTVKVQKLVTPAGENRIAIPAKYGTKSKRQLVEEGKFIWHEIHNMELAKETRTGNQVCLKEVPAKYRTDTRTVVTEVARTETVEVPAIYKTVKVQKLVTSASENRIAIPAEYQEVTRTDMVTDGKLEWRWVLCETNMTVNAVSKIQSALNTAGYDVGKADGNFGTQSARALKKYQEDKGLATGGITKESLESLGITL